MVSDQKAANMLKKSKLEPDSHDRDATKILIKIGEDVSGENLTVARTILDSFLAKAKEVFERIKALKIAFGKDYMANFAERRAAHHCPCSFCASIPSTLIPMPYTLNPAPYTLHPTPCTLHPTPCTLHPTPKTSNTKPCCAEVEGDPGDERRFCRIFTALKRVLLLNRPES
jgi:hypothetical protein